MQKSSENLTNKINLTPSLALLNPGLFHIISIFKLKFIFTSRPIFFKFHVDKSIKGGHPGYNSKFYRKTHEGQSYGHNWSSHNTHNDHFGHNWRKGLNKYCHKFELYGCPWKICSKCRSPVKTVLKKIQPTEFYGQNN